MAQPAFAQATQAETTRLRTAVTDAIEEGVHAARRAVKHGLYAAEDMVDDAAHEVKRHPFQAVATASMLSFTAGILVGWMIFGLRRR